MSNRSGVVFLIGAGPGDPKLITLRGLECLQKADVLVYDRLASPHLLSWVHPEAERIYVGKGPDRHTLRQEEINQLLVKKAREGKVVARLKGGDPFVFGRGGEEAEALVEAGIRFEIVPGVTSAVAVPAYAGIPVTHRDFTSTLAIVTGHEDPLKESSSIAWEHLAQSAGTIVFLMGMENLPQIVQQLMKYGRKGDTPVALIRWGTRPDQLVVTGILENIVDKARKAGLTSPVVIVVGEVVTMRQKLQWIEKRPLFGRRVVVTRSRAQASVLTRRLEDLGTEVWEFPTIEIVPPADLLPLEQRLKQLSDYQWVIFTSVNGVESFFRCLWAIGGDIRELQGVQLAAIGPATGKSLEDRGLRVNYIPDEFRAEAIADGLTKRVKPGDKILLPRAREARSVLPEMLRKLGALVDEVVAYETVAGTGNAQKLRQLLKHKQITAVTFTSSSTVRNFLSLLLETEQPIESGKPLVIPELEGVVIACIGPITAQTAQNLGLKVDVVAEQYTIDGLVEALTNYLITHRP
ncbi:MAG: uroporphyrinogen-III C-methyltransferase [Bacillota bacterium]|jgi:uroporphyrinogen III methyltransferase/synthase